MTEHSNLRETISRLLPILEEAVASQRLAGLAEDAVLTDMAKLREALAPEPELLQPPPGVDPRDTVTVLGDRADGSRVVLGTAAMSPQAKLRELAREQFGHFDEDDFSNEVDAYHLACRVLAEVLKKPLTLTAAVDLARNMVVAQFGDFRDDEGTTAADAFYIAEALLKWMQVAHPSRFALG